MEDESARIKVLLLELVKETSNSTCADCGERDPQWASANLGIFICIVCAGIHRNLGVHISRVRSLMLDTWRAEELEVMTNIGNHKSNQKWEGGLCENTPIRTSDSVALREQWIRAKYVRKLYVLQDETQTKEIGFPCMEGWMTKMGDVVKNWKRRYFKLSGSTLFYYKKPMEQTPKGALNMIEATRTPDCVTEPIPERPYCFVISTPNRDYYVCAESGEGMYDWVQTLRTARRYLSAPSAFGFTGKARDIAQVEQIVGELAHFATQKRKVAGKTYAKCILGSQIVDLLVHNFQLENRQEAVFLGQTLVDKGLVRPCVPEPFGDAEKIYYIA